MFILTLFILTIFYNHNFYIDEFYNDNFYIVYFYIEDFYKARKSGKSSSTLYELLLGQTWSQVNDAENNKLMLEMGKWKTATQMLGIPLLMANESWLEIPIPFIGTLLIYLACILSLWSAIHYTYNMIQKLKQKKELKKEKKEDPQGESS